MNQIAGLQNVRLFNNTGLHWITFKNGHIASIQPMNGDPISVKEGTLFDGHGLLACPAMIDTHTHARIPGNGQSETAETFFDSAIYGGVGALAMMPNTTPSISTHGVFGQVVEQIGKRPVAYKFWFGATPDNGQEIQSVAQDPYIAGVKVYMGSSTGNLLVEHIDDQRKIFQLCAELGLLVAVHAENEAMMRQIRGQLGRAPGLHDHCKIRQTGVEVSAVRQALALAKETGCRLHLCHLSTPESVQLAYDAKEAGLNLTVEVCPHHLLLDDSYFIRGDCALFKMNPPLRTREQVQEMIKLLIRPGFVDIIATDHAPHTKEAKESREYDNIPSGVTGLQTLFSLMTTLAISECMGMDYLFELTARNPAKLLGYSKKGQIEEGFEADIVLYDPYTQSSIKNIDMKTKCGWTPYNGMIVRGTPQVVILGGNVVLDRTQENES